MQKVEAWKYSWINKRGRLNKFEIQGEGFDRKSSDPNTHYAHKKNL